MPKARAAALTALKLDDTLGEAHAALAFVRGYKWDWQGAERNLEAPSNLVRITRPRTNGISFFYVFWAVR